jgi:aminoglycoside 6'-N-acetyltransferase I
VQLRPATPDDLDALVELALAFYVGDGFTTGEAALRANWTALLALDSVRSAVAEEDGRVLGFAVTTSHIGLENGLLAELEDIYVRPEARNRGIARALIEDCAQWARQRGIGLIDVCIAPNGQDVSHLFDFCRARGFRDEGRRLVHLDLS